MRFAQKNVLVTGAAAGLGRHVAQAFAAEGREATPMNRFVEPQEVAAVMVFLCNVDASAMTGQAINVTGGFIMT
ncbi:MAG TPA: SDR family oxidoreductase [Roseiarcus sp.]